MAAITTKNERYPHLGDGIYLAYDVAQILKLPYHKVRHLMTGYWQSYTFGSEQSRAINFHALIEFYIFYFLREQNFSASEIKKLHAKLAKDFNTKHPFASLKLKINPKAKNDGKGQLWIDVNGELMKADGKLQPAFRSFIEEYLKKIEFGEDGLASRFFPLRGVNNSTSIVVDPLHQFGQPVIAGTNLQAATVHTLFEAGESKRNISILYNIDEKVIDDVLVYYEKRA